MMVQMKMPADTKAMDRYLLAEYLQGKKKERQNQPWIFSACRLDFVSQVLLLSEEAGKPLLQDDYSQDHVRDERSLQKNNNA